MDIWDCLNGAVCRDVGLSDAANPCCASCGFVGGFWSSFKGCECRTGTIAHIGHLSGGDGTEESAVLITGTERHNFCFGGADPGSDTDRRLTDGTETGVSAGIIERFTR